MWIGIVQETETCPRVLRIRNLFFLFNNCNTVSCKNWKSWCQWPVTVTSRKEPVTNTTTLLQLWTAIINFLFHLLNLNLPQSVFWKMWRSHIATLHCKYTTLFWKVKIEIVHFERTIWQKCANIVNKQPVKGVFSFIFHKFVASMWHLVVTTTGRFREVTFYWNWTLHRW